MEASCNLAASFLCYSYQPVLHHGVQKFFDVRRSELLISFVVWTDAEKCTIKTPDLLMHIPAALDLAKLFELVHYPFDIRQGNVLWPICYLEDSRSDLFR